MSTQFFSFSDDTPFSTEAVLVNASSSHYEEDWPSIPHTHAFTELFYVSEGSGEFLIENQHFSIKKDDLIIVNPHIQHTEISLSVPRHFLIIRSVWTGSVFPFMIRRNSRSFTAARSTPTFYFIFILFFRNWMKKMMVMKRSANTRWPF